MRIAFMGTPDFAAASLRKLIESGFDVAAVFTQPDKPRDRGMKESASPVKLLAQERGIPVHQPEKLRDGSAARLLREIAPDLLIVVAYGRILPAELLAIPPLGCVNVHASLLPKYRGSAPIQWTVLNGDDTAGVTTMYMAEELDSGDIIYQRSTPVGERETSGELFERLAELGAELLCETARDIETGTAPRTPQDETGVSFARRLEKTDSPIDWSRSTREIIKHIYGMQPWPVATMELDGVTARVFAAACTDTKTDAPAGSIVSAGKAGIELACGDGGTLLVTELQLPGKKRMSAADFLRGHPLKTL